MPEWNEEPLDIQKLLKNAGILLWTVGSLLGLAAILSTVVFIPVGHEGVKFNRLSGHVASTTLKQGWQLRMPFLTQVTVYDCRRKDYTMSANANEGQYRGQSDTNWSPTADGNSVGLDITVWYRIPQDTAGKVY